jgi:hypothetical protein
LSGGNKEQPMADQDNPQTTPTGGAGAAPRDAINDALAKGKAFAKARPAATAALAGVLGIALINTLRGRR